MVKALMIHALRMWFGCHSDAVLMWFGSLHRVLSTESRAEEQSAHHRFVPECESCGKVQPSGENSRTSHVLSDLPSLLLQ